MSEQQKAIIEQIAADIDSIADDGLAQLAAAKISGFAEGVKAAQLAQADKHDAEE